MELKLEEVKATLIRLQGQIDVWNNLYQILMNEDKKVETSLEPASKS